MSSRAPRRESGFTVLELLAALAIVAVGLSLVMPRLAGARATRSLEDATSALVLHLEQARSRAMASGKSVLVSIDPVSRSYASDAGAGRRLPRGVVIDGSAPAPLQVIFHPDGTATDRAFALRADGARARVGVDWLTGRVTVAFER
jgi:type II secretion system protein H